jgi:hypothetical protein
MSKRRERQEQPFTNFGAIGDTPAFQYWNDFVNVYMNTMQTEMLRTVGVWQRWALGDDDSKGVGDIPAMWRSWFLGMSNLGVFPYEWWMRRDATVPSIVFLVDQCTQSAGPQSAPTPIAAQGLTSTSTPLWSLTQPGVRLDPDHVCLEIICAGNRIQVSLVDLAKVLPDDHPAPLPPGGVTTPPATGTVNVGAQPTPAPVPQNLLQPGVYASLVFAWDQENVTGRPLAIVYAFVNPP